MTYLLDTHTFLWLVNSPEILPNRVINIIQDRLATVLVSLIVPWEIAIKVKIGKLDAAEVLKDFEAKATRAKLTMLGTTVPQVIRSGSLPLHHRDPFDRLLIAQAFELRIPILSSDRIMDLYGVQRIWD
jgi:PIN domain nuclease of toxin-antitoxin system